jgi:hypothetical protein
MTAQTTKIRSVLLATVVAVALLTAAFGHDDGLTATPAVAAAETTELGHDPTASTTAAELHSTLQELWADHMQWTYATVDAFFHNTDALDPTLHRLLTNQSDIGGAIASFYGDEAGDQLTELLTTHIDLAVPVLQAAQAADGDALGAATDDWYANAQEIADFLSAANPDNWPQTATRPALEMHIDQTTAYAVDLLEGNYAKAIQDYDAAFDHMMDLADILAAGIVEQFPDRFDD